MPISHSTPSLQLPTRVSNAYALLQTGTNHFTIGKSAYIKLETLRHQQCLLAIAMAAIVHNSIKCFHNIQRNITPFTFRMRVDIKQRSTKAPGGGGGGGGGGGLRYRGGPHLSYVFHGRRGLF